MASDIRLPNITSTDLAGRVTQIQSFLYQLVQDLNYILSTIESGNVVVAAPVASSGSGQADAAAVYSQIKYLLMNSSEVTQAYYDKLVPMFNQIYAGLEEFKTYRIITNAEIAMLKERVDALENP